MLGNSCTACTGAMKDDEAPPLSCDLMQSMTQHWDSNVTSAKCTEKGLQQKRVLTGVITHSSQCLSMVV